MGKQYTLPNGLQVDMTAGQLSVKYPGKDHFVILTQSVEDSRVLAEIIRAHTAGK